MHTTVMYRHLYKKLLSDSRFKYLAVGGLSFAFEYAIFLLLIQLSVEYFFSNSFSFLVGLTISFMLHKTWSFSNKDTSRTKTQAISYVILAAVNLLLTNLFFYILVELGGFSPFIVKFISMFAVVTWNYLIMKKLIFAPLQH